MKGGDTMTNEVLLEDAIRKSGKKKSYLAEKIGVSPTHFGKLLRNKYEFTASQISILCDELTLSSEMRDLIFFAVSD